MEFIGSTSDVMGAHLKRSGAFLKIGQNGRRSGLKVNMLYFESRPSSSNPGQVIVLCSCLVLCSETLWATWLECKPYICLFYKRKSLVIVGAK